LSGDELASLSVSLQTAFLSGLLAVVFGTWGAIAAHSTRFARLADAMHHLPMAVPSVVIGLGLLVAFSRQPLLLPAISSAAGLSVALSMGEVGATIMVYPASWRTLPVSIFALTDRGQAFVAAAEAVVLLATTVVLVLILDRLRGRAAER
jgi:2-aminoethylphosphonate transport system permease protein